MLSAIIGSLTLSATAQITHADSLKSVCEVSDSIKIAKFEESIDLIGFEKRLSDKNEAFIIRNNSSETIKRVTIKMLYRTPSNEVISYRNVTFDGEIAPSGVKLFSCESFDTDKRYYYTDSPKPSKIGDGFPFTITYKLISYDISVSKDNFR